LKRPPGFENPPTVAETVPDFFVGAWTVLLAPKARPKAILNKMHNDMQYRAGRSRISRRKLALNGGFVRHMTSRGARHLRTERQKTWRPILEQVAKEAQK
jgi:tripartite-type tricarboxylate transporter receptor subunit TctC